MDGVINVLKPAGITSRQVVSIVKRITKEKKVGHAGTLDPGAAGVLPIMIGKATRFFDILGDEQKEYIAEFVFGKQTNTSDSYGEIIKEIDCDIEISRVKEVLSSFIGEIKQTPSIYSAIHINGKRAYDYAFKGKEVELPQRVVKIYELELLEKTNKNSYLFRILCSKGCYIRSLCEDMARKLDTVAYMSFLLRTKTSRFTIEDTITMDQLEDSFKIKKLDEVLSFMPKITIQKEYTKMLHNGNKLPIEATKDTIDPDRLYLIYDSFGELCGVGGQDEDIIRVKILLRDKDGDI